MTSATSNLEVLRPSQNDDNTSFEETFATDVLLGLSKTHRELSSKYIYDDEGSHLFEQIMELPEYYLTNCETEILNMHKQAFADTTDIEPFNLVELGAGNGKKTSILLQHFLDEKLDFTYIPLDISKLATGKLLGKLAKDFPALKTHGIVAEYFSGLNWLRHHSKRKNFVLFMGSNIGNFPPQRAREFLMSLWNSLQPGDFLAIGFDLKKDLNIMRAAYNDSKGVTATFNKNLLKRINRELGGDFDINEFRFYSTFNPLSGAIESFLISLTKQLVHIEKINRTFHFHQWEAIHTEYSFKYTIPGIHELAEQSGYEVQKDLFDSRHYFVDSIWKVHK